MRPTIVVALTLSIVALAFNTFWVDSRTRAAAPRDGGRIIDTTVVPANAKAEGAGPAIVLLHLELRSIGGTILPRSLRLITASSALT
jgi:hypothetical protein